MGTWQSSYNLPCPHKHGNRKLKEDVGSLFFSSSAWLNIRHSLFLAENKLLLYFPCWQTLKHLLFRGVIASFRIFLSNFSVKGSIFSLSVLVNKANFTFKPNPPGCPVSPGNPSGPLSPSLPCRPGSPWKPGSPTRPGWPGGCVMPWIPGSPCSPFRLESKGMENDERWSSFVTPHRVDADNCSHSLYEHTTTKQHTHPLSPGLPGRPGGPFKKLLSPIWPGGPSRPGSPFLPGGPLNPGSKKG